MNDVFDITCERGLCQEPARWLVDMGGRTLAERCDEHRPDADAFKSWPLDPTWKRTMLHQSPDTKEGK